MISAAIFEQGVGVVGLHEHLVGAGLQRLLVHRRGRRGGQDDDRKVFQLKRLPQRVQELHAVEPRHVEIEHQHVGQAARQVLDRNLVARVEPVAGELENDFPPDSSLHLVQGALEKVHIVRIVLDQHDLAGL